VTELIRTIITIVLFLGILGILVVIHELGHFVMARLFGVRVDEFGIGFPPRAKIIGVGQVDPADTAKYEADLATAAGRAQIDPDTHEELIERGPPGGTVYTLNWLPIGGFVKLHGEDGDRAEDPRAFSSQRLSKRLVILVAGVAMNVVLAFVIFAGLALHGDPLIGHRIESVQAGSPAETAGIAVGDVLFSLDGTRYGAFGTAFLLDDLQKKAGEQVELGIERPDGTAGTVTAVLRSPAEVSAQKGALGVTTSVATARAVDGREPVEAVRVGAQRTVGALGLILGGLGDLVGSVAEDPTAPPPVAGPVGIATQLGSIFWQLGPLMTLYVAGILSANLAIVNVLPFPPLDGGRMLMITLKELFGARISVRAEQMTYLVGFVFLFAFIIWVTGFDIARGLGGGAPGAP
jgi:regulator of sigma E protease